MVKKILLGVAFAGLIGVLTFGAVNRTLALRDPSYAGQGAGQGYRQEQGGPWQSDGYGRGGGSGRQGGRGGQSGDHWTQPGGGPADRPAGDPQAGRGGQGGGWAQPGQQLEWVTLQGVVASADGDGMVVNLADGKTVEAVNRAWWYAKSQGFTVSVGDQVSLHGFYDADKFEAGQINDQTNNQSVTLRDEAGRPMWAGPGNRSV